MKTIRLLMAYAMIVYMGSFVGIVAAEHDGAGVCVGGVAGFALSDVMGEPVPAEIGGTLHGTLGFTGVVVQTGINPDDPTTSDPTQVWPELWGSQSEFESSCCASFNEGPDCFEPVS